MRTIKFTNSRGQSITIAPGVFPYTLENIKGTGGEGVKANNQFEKSPYQDGATYLDTDLETREISITFNILTETEQEAGERRRESSRIINPKLGPGTLIYTTNGKSYSIAAVPTTPPNFLDGKENRSNGHQKSDITFECPDPYWTDTQETIIPMTAFTGLFKFPLELPTQMGTKGDRQIFNNIGDEEAPVLIEFKGPATNPRVTNETTGEYIQINRQLSDTDTLFVNTAFGNKRVELVDGAGDVTNVFNWVEEGSTFFRLLPGENQITYSGQAGGVNAIVSIKYKNRYIGV